MKTRRPVSIYTPLSVRPRPPPPSTTRLLLSSRAGHPARGGDLDSWRPPSRAGSRAAADPPASSSLLFSRTCRVSGLEKSSSAAAIKKAYRQLALRWRPDKNPGDADANAKFQEIGRAYAVLSDAKKRKYYDETGDAEDVDVSAEDFIAVFQDMMRDMLGGASIAPRARGTRRGRSRRTSPPFPFPEALFPPGTFHPECVSRRTSTCPRRSRNSSSAEDRTRSPPCLAPASTTANPTDGESVDEDDGDRVETKPKLGADADAEGARGRAGGFDAPPDRGGRAGPRVGSRSGSGFGFPGSPVFPGGRRRRGRSGRRRARGDDGVASTRRVRSDAAGGCRRGR